MLKIISVLNHDYNHTMQHGKFVSSWFQATDLVMACRHVL